MEIENDSCKNERNKIEGFSFFDHIKTEYHIMKNKVTKNEVTEGDSSISEKISLRPKSVKNNDNIKSSDHGNAKKCQTIVNNFPYKINNTIKTNEKHIEKRWTCCLHIFKCPFTFDGFDRTTLKLSFVSIAYIVIYMPWFIFTVSRRVGTISEQKDHLLFKYIYQPVEILPFLGCAINPVIYAFVDPKFRSQCRALFQ